MAKLDDLAIMVAKAKPKEGISTEEPGSKTALREAFKAQSDGDEEAYVEAMHSAIVMAQMEEG
jgi:hypothetical protein